MTRVLVLRPEPGASTTVEGACSRGLDAIAVPLFEIEPIEWLAPETGSFDGLLLTSANAIGFGGKQLRKLRNLKVYAVGQATAEAAHDAGFDIAATGEAGVDGLLASIDPDLKLLHLCGANRREPRDAKQAITTVIVYHSNEIETSDFPVTPDIVALIHSPRAGRRFA